MADLDSSLGGAPTSREELLESYATGNRFFVGEHFRKVDLSLLDLGGAKFRGSQFTKVVLDGASLSGSDSQAVDSKRVACEARSSLVQT